MKWHPYAENYPLLEEKEYDLFKADVAARGVREAVKYRVVNGEKEYLDGRNRVQACKDMRVTWPEERVEVADDQVEQFIDSLNLHRRHLTQDQRKARVAILLQRGQSTRQAAEALRVSHSTVQRDAADLESTGTNVPVDRNRSVVGKDGKRRKARTAARRTGTPAPKKKPKPLLCERCQRVGVTKDCPGCAEVRKPTKERQPGDDTDEEEAAAKEEWLDAAGEPVPAKASIAFERAKQLAAICRQIDEIIHRVDAISQDVKAIAEGDGGRLVDAKLVVTRLMETKPKLEEAKGNLWANRATHVCPYCRGKADNCDCCKGEGWTNRWYWEQAPGNNGKVKR
jgi:hypothetical protein